MQTITQVTPGQIKQVKRFLEDALDRTIAGGLINKAGIQKLIENGDEFQTRILTCIIEFLVSNQFADEEVKSNFEYPSSYRKPKLITEQCNILRQIFPGIGFADEKLAEREVPKSAEGWFAIPKWQTLAPTYSEAVQKVLYDDRYDLIRWDDLRQSAKTEAVFQRLGDEQKGYDILVVAGQFGLRHRGRSVRRAHEVMHANECGLGAFAVGIMLLTHPERLSHCNDLWIDCAGDEFDATNASASLARVPFFEFCFNEIRSGSSLSNVYCKRYGSASAFVP